MVEGGLEEGRLVEGRLVGGIRRRKVVGRGGVKRKVVRRNVRWDDIGGVKGIDSVRGAIRGCIDKV